MLLRFYLAMKRDHDFFWPKIRIFRSTPRSSGFIAEHVIENTWFNCSVSASHFNW